MASHDPRRSPAIWVRVHLLLFQLVPRAPSLARRGKLFDGGLPLKSRSGVFMAKGESRSGEAYLCWRGGHGTRPVGRWKLGVGSSNGFSVPWGLAGSPAFP